MAAENKDIQWSTETVFITDIIRESQLPVLVKVADGWCGDSEAESFSIGDLIKLDFVKCIQKVKAVLITKGNKRSEEIFIPLGYKGKVKITRVAGKSFHSVEELMKVFPKYVSVEQAFDSEPTHYHAKVHIKKGEHLELDRFIEEKGLVAKQLKSNKSIVISTSGKYHFTSEIDNNEYTISEVIEKYPLPQIVSFVGDEVQRIFTTSLEEALENIHAFSGRLKLLGLSTEDVVVGHYKPLTQSSEEEKFVHRNIILLPTNRTVMKELEVFLPVEKDTQDYEMLVATNFSQQLNMSAVDGALYVEMAKKPRNMIQLSLTENKECDTPPPIIPPRRQPTGKAKSRKAAAPRRSTSLPGTRKSDSEKEYEQVSDKKGKTLAKRKMSVDSASNTNLENYEVLEKGDDDDPTDDYDEIADFKIEEEDKKKSKDKKGKTLYKTIKDILPFRRQPIPAGVDDKDSKPKQSNPITDNECDYQELDLVKLSKSDWVQKKETSSERPILVVKPQTRPLPNPNLPHSYNKHIDEMTISEVVDCLRFCSLDRLAKICDANELDGAFLSFLSDEQLKAEPYCLDNMELTKFQTIKMGWRPKK